MDPRRETFDHQTVWNDFAAEADMIIEVIDLLVRDLPISVKALLAGAKSGDLTAVGRAAHKVVGAAGTMAADPICELGRAIELRAREGSLDAVRTLCEPVSNACDRLIADLTAWRNELARVMQHDGDSVQSCRS